ncbi:hypothetical protein Esti_002732 [Eimeria stiedai]
MRDCIAASDVEEEGLDGRLAQTQQDTSAADNGSAPRAFTAAHGNSSSSCTSSRSRNVDQVVLSSNESLSPASSKDESDKPAPLTSSSSSRSDCWVRLKRGNFSVYLLQSLSSPLHFYVGCTTNPLRRLRQHNGELQQGARRTLSHRPWRLCLVLWGFPSLVCALQFEFRWQQGLVPAASLRALCCSSRSGAVCCCSSCSSCSARRRQRRQLQGSRPPPPKSRKPSTQLTVQRAEAAAAAKTTLAAAEAAAATAAARAAAAAAQWELLELQAAAADDSRCCRAPFVYTRRRSKDALQRLEAELQQLLLLLHGPPFCRLPLHLHACATDVAELFQDLLLYPCCGGGAKRHSNSSSSSSGRALAQLPEQITVSSGPVESIASLQGQALQQVRAKCSSSSSSSGCTCCFGGSSWLGRPHVSLEANGWSSRSPAVASPTAAGPAALEADPAAASVAVKEEAASTETAAATAAAGTAAATAAAAAACSLCACPFLERQRALLCPQCEVYVHLTCAGRYSLQQEAAGRMQQQQQAAAAVAAAAAGPPGQRAAERDSDPFLLLPVRWWCSHCSRRVFWGFVLNHLYIRGPHGVPAKRPVDAVAAAANDAADSAAPASAEAAAVAAADDPERVGQQFNMGEHQAAEQTPTFAADASFVAAESAVAAAAPPAVAAPPVFDAGREQALPSRCSALARTASEPVSCERSSSQPVPSNTRFSTGNSSSSSSSVPPLLERLRLQSCLSGKAPN